MNNLKSVSELLNEMHQEYVSLVGDGKVLTKSIKYRRSPHEPSVIINELKPTDDYRYDRQLLATINQVLIKLNK